MMGATVVAFLVHKREQLREDMDLNYGREQWNQGGLVCDQPCSANQRIK